MFVSLYGKSNLTALNPQTGVIAGTVILSAYNDSEGGTPRHRLWLKPMASSMSVCNDSTRPTRAKAAWSSRWTVRISVPFKPGTWATTPMFADGKAPENFVAAEALVPIWVGSTPSIPKMAPRPLIAEMSHKASKIATYGKHRPCHWIHDWWTGPAYGIQCVDLQAGTSTELYLGNSYINGIAANNLGHAYVTAAVTDAEGPAGVYVYDIESCTAVSTDWQALHCTPTAWPFIDALQPLPVSRLRLRSHSGGV